MKLKGPFSSTSRMAAKLMSHVTAEYRRTFDLAEQHQHPQTWIHETLKPLYNEENTEFYRLTQRCQSYLRGYLDALRGAHQRLLVFSYVHDGKQVLLGSPEYKQIRPVDIDTETGAWVYMAPPHRIFY